MFDDFSFLQMSDEAGFAWRAAGALAALIISALLTRELYGKIRLRLFNAAFWLVLPLQQLAFGMLCTTTWAAIYTFFRISGHSADWMRTSVFIPFYIGVMFASAVELIYALTLSVQKAVLGAGALAVCWLIAYHVAHAIVPAVAP